MAIHLLMCCFLFSSAFYSNMLQEVSLVSNWTLPTQMVSSGYSLAGILVISCALYGAVQRNETIVRLYLYFLLFTFVLDTSILTGRVLFSDMCAGEGDLARNLGHQFGDAFLCGSMQSLTYFFVAAAVMVQAYALWVVWSFCEDVHQGNSGPELSELLFSKGDVIQKRRDGVEGPYAGIVGLVHGAMPGAHAMSPYGSLESGELPESETFFGGTSHNMNYPRKMV